MSKYDYDKYGVSIHHTPAPFQVTYEVDVECPHCEEDIYEGDWCSYWDEKLMHEECADAEWELSV